MDSGIRGPFGRGGEYGNEESPPTKKRPKRPGDAKADDVAKEAFGNSEPSPASSPPLQQKKGKANEAPLSNMKTAKVAKETVQKAGAASFQRELAEFDEDDRARISENIENGLSNRSEEDKQSIIDTVKAFLAGREIGMFEISDAIYDIARIPMNQRQDALNQALPIINKVDSAIFAGSILETIGKIPQEERSEVIALATPLLQRFNDPSSWRNIIYTIHSIPKDVRARVLKEVVNKHPDYDWGSLSNMIDLQVAKIEKEQKKPDLKRARDEEHEEKDTRALKGAKTTPPDAMSVVRASVARKKIRKVIETAEQNKTLPLTPEEFEFLATRSIGLRYSEKADKEFTKGLHGDAVSLSGYPRQQLKCDRGERVFQEWEQYVKPTKDPSEGPRTLEERIGIFIDKFIGNGFPRYGEDVKTRDYLELAKLTHNVKFLLANFKEADIPYDLQTYYGIGKCGKQFLGTEEDAKGQGRLMKYITLSSDFFANLPLTEAELDLPISETFAKIKQAAIQDVGQKVRLHIRKLCLMNKAFSE